MNTRVPTYVMRSCGKRKLSWEEADNKNYLNRTSGDFEACFACPLEKMLPGGLDCT